MKMKRYCFALDLIDDEKLIKEYEDHHTKVWPEIITGIRESGIQNMEIYRVGNRMFMIMEVNDGFSFEKKAIIDTKYPQNEQWEQLMWNYQQALPMAKPGEKWLLMKKIFQL